MDWFDNSTESAHPVFGKVRVSGILYSFLNISHSIDIFFLKITVICYLQIVEGMDLVKKISEVPTRNDNPSDPIKMISVRVGQ